MSTAVSMYRDPKKLELIQRTVAKDANRDEFSAFIHICQNVNLDPLRKQIYCFVFNKDDAAKRQMTVVTAITGYRAIADRTKCYRPGAIEIVYDDGLKNENTNPLGILCARATVFKFAHGEWHPTTDEAYWEEFAPISKGGSEGEEWEDIPGQFHPVGHKNAGKPKRRKVIRGDAIERLDPSKGGWRKMGRVMIGKCAEGAALRRAFPDDFAGLYVEEELDRAHIIDLTAAEMVEQAREEKRAEMIGGTGKITIFWMDGNKAERVDKGQIYDRFMAWSRGQSATGIVEWYDFNIETLKEFWSTDPAAFLEIKKVYEGAGETAAKEKLEQDALRAEADHLQAAE